MFVVQFLQVENFIMPLDMYTGPEQTDFLCLPYYGQLNNYCSTCHGELIANFLFADKMHSKKCTVFPFHPWDSKEHRRSGIVLWVPATIEELIRTTSEKLEVLDGICILSEDAACSHKWKLD